MLGIYITFLNKLESHYLDYRTQMVNLLVSKQCTEMFNSPLFNKSSINLGLLSFGTYWYRGLLGVVIRSKLHLVSPREIYKVRDDMFLLFFVQVN